MFPTPKALAQYSGCRLSRFATRSGNHAVRIRQASQRGRERAVEKDETRDSCEQSREPAPNRKPMKTPRRNRMPVRIGKGVLPASYLALHRRDARAKKRST